MALDPSGDGKRALSPIGVALSSLCDNGGSEEGTVRGGISIARVLGLAWGSFGPLFVPFLGGVFSTLEGLNTRKTRVLELPGARKNVEMHPRTLVKYEVSAGTPAFSLDLAAFWGLKIQPNRAKTLCSQLKPRKMRYFSRFC